MLSPLTAGDSHPVASFVVVDPLVGHTSSYACLQDTCANSIPLVLRRGTWVYQSRPISRGARYLAEQQQRARRQQPGQPPVQQPPILSPEEVGWQRVFIWVEGCTLFTAASEGFPSSNIPPDPVGIMPPIFLRQQAEGAELIAEDVVAAGIANYLHAPKINTAPIAEDEGLKRVLIRASNLLSQSPSPFVDDDAEEIWAARNAARSYAAQLAACTWALSVGDSREILIICDTDAIATAWVRGITDAFPLSPHGNPIKRRFGQVPSSTIVLKKDKGTNDSFGRVMSSSSDGSDAASSHDEERDEDGLPVADMTAENDEYQPQLTEAIFARLIMLFDAVEVEEGFVNGGEISARQFELDYIDMVAKVVATRIASTADIAFSAVTGTPHPGRPFPFPLGDLVSANSVTANIGKKLNVSQYIINLALSLVKTGDSDITTTIATLHDIVQATASRIKLTVHNLHDIRVHLRRTISLKFGYIDQYSGAENFQRPHEQMDAQKRAFAAAVKACMAGTPVQKSASGFNQELIQMSLFNDASARGSVGKGGMSALDREDEALGGGSWKDKVMWLSKIGADNEAIEMPSQEGAGHVYRLHYGKKKAPVVAGVVNGNGEATHIEVSDIIDVYRFGAHEMQQLKAPERLWTLGFCIRLNTGRTMNVACESEDEVRSWCVALNVLRPETKQEWEDRSRMERDMNRLSMLQAQIWRRSVSTLEAAMDIKCAEVLAQRKAWRKALAVERRELHELEQTDRNELLSDQQDDFVSIADLAAASKEYAFVKASKRNPDKVSRNVDTGKSTTATITIPGEEVEPEVEFLTAEQQYEKDMREYLNGVTAPLPPVMPQKAESNKCCSIQ